MNIPRRTLLKAGGLVAIASAPLPFLFHRTEKVAEARPLLKAPSGLLDLPKGFSYRIIDRAFQPMSDGLRVPARPDGMACFDGPGDTLILMRNHELDVQPDQGAYGSPPSEAYDPRTFGGVSRVVLKKKTLEKPSSNLFLAGTLLHRVGLLRVP